MSVPSELVRICNALRLQAASVANKTGDAVALGVLPESCEVLADRTYSAAAELSDLVALKLRENQ